MVDKWVKREEWAELVVGGAVYSEWKSVWAEMRLGGPQPYYHFRFTSTEAQPFARSIAVLRIRPGDSFQLYLAGHLAMTGTVTTRQVYYDAKQHSVELTGVSYSYDLAIASAITKTGNFKDQNWQQMANTLVKPFGIPVSLLGDQIGKAMAAKFPRAAIQLGETVNEFIERYARPLGIQLSSDERGALVAVAGRMGGTAAVIEGDNILIGREVISIPDTDNSVDLTKGQKPGDNESYGPPAHHVNGQDAQTTFGNRYLPRLVMSEIPAWTEKLMKGRSATEGLFSNTTKIVVTVTVYGWEYTPGALWYRGQTVHVNSPMLLMKQDLIASKVTFTQDVSTGSRTTLELVNELGAAPLMVDLRKDELKTIAKKHEKFFPPKSPEDI